MECQENRSCVKQPANSLPDLRPRCTGCDGNDLNEFQIVVKCPHEVLRSEWLDLLLAINDLLQTYRAGKYSNVEAHLEVAR